MPTTDESRPYLTFRQWYERTGISRTKAIAELDSGRIPARKLGSKILIAKEDADAWFANLPPARVKP
jgi:excisionase family DNA binding protein